MSNYKIGQRVLIKTSYKDDAGVYHLAGRPGVLKNKSERYSSDYEVEVEMPDGPWVMRVRQSRGEGEGFLLDTPESRKKYPVPDWNQIDLKEWHKAFIPSGIRVDGDKFGGFINKIAEACGGIETDGKYDRTSYNYYSDSSRNTITYIFPAEERVKAFWELLRWLERWGQRLYGQGVKDGHNLLAQLNAGQITLDEMEGKVSDRQVKFYNRHEWLGQKDEGKK